MERALPSYDLPAWVRFCARHGFQPIGKSEMRDVNVYVAERKERGIAVSLDPIESVTHWVVAWALEEKVNDRPQMTFGRTVKLRAIEVPFQDQRIKVALADAADHLRMATSGRVH